MGENMQVIEDLERIAAEAEAADAKSGEWEQGPAAGEKEKKPGPSTAEAVGGLLFVTFALIATRAGDHWALSEKESEAAGESYGALLDKYYGEFDAGVEVAAALTTVALIAPRLAITKAKAQQAAAEGGADE